LPVSSVMSSVGLRRVARVAAGGVLLLIVAAAAAPWLVETETARRSIERQVSALAGGDVRYESVEFHSFPRPRGVFRGVAIDTSGVQGRIAVVHATVAWLPLLLGEVRPVAIRIEQPAIEIRIQPGDARDPVAAYRAVAGPIVEVVTRKARGLSVSINDGTIDVVAAGQPLVSLSRVMAEAEVSAESIEAGINAAANTWRDARGRFRIDAGTLAASAKLDVKGLRADRLFAPSATGGSLVVRAGAIDARVDARTDGRSTVRVTANASGHQLRLERGARALELGVSKIAGEGVLEGQTIAITLRALQLQPLLSGASGTLRMRADGTEPTLQLSVPALDLAQLREGALALAGDLNGVRAVTDTVEAGALRDLTLIASGRDFAALAQGASVAARAQLEAATVAVPAAGLLVKNGRGDLSLADGVLAGTELSGTIGASSFRSGRLTVAILPAVLLRQISAELDADLTDVLAFSRRLFARRDPAALAGIETLQGRASGTVAYASGSGRPQLTVEAGAVRASGRYRGVPFPFEVSRAALRYAEGRVQVRGLNGGAGRSHVKDGAFDLALGREPVIRAASGEASLVLDELFPWLITLEPLRPILGVIQNLTGAVDVQLARLSGPLAQPAALEYEARIRPRPLRIESAMLPAPLALSAGEAAITARTVKAERIAVAMDDARVSLSGTFENYAAPNRQANLELSEGVFGERTLDWARRRWHMPAQAMPRAPAEIATARVRWHAVEGQRLAAQARGRLGRAVDIDFDAEWRAGEFDLKHVALKDADTDVKAALRWEPGALDVSFEGTLDSRTLARMLAHSPAERGAIRGNFSAAVNLREPQRSLATGMAEGDGIDLARRFGIPLAIEHFRFEAAEKMLQVRESTVLIAGQSVEVNGSVGFGRGRFTIDGRLAAKTLDAARILALIVPKDAAGAGQRPARDSWDLPVEGRTTIAVGSLTYGKRELRQVGGTLSIASNRIVAQVTDARLCDIAVPFTAAVALGRVELKLQMKARGEGLGPALKCLAGEQLAATGTYDLDAEFSASGRGDALLRSALGRFRFAARAGRVHRAEALSRTLALDEVAQRMEAAPAQVMKTGLDYEEVVFAGTLEAGRVRIERATLDSGALGVTVSGEVGLADGSIELQGLIAPMDTTHRALRRVPVVGRVLGASLVVVPVEIRGSINDPQVRVLRAAAVGATLLNLMSTTFLLPIELLDISQSTPVPKP